jgi:hypothetical protein
MNIEVIINAERWTNICERQPDESDQAPPNVLVLLFNCDGTVHRAPTAVLQEHAANSAMCVKKTGDNQKQNGLLRHTPYSPNLVPCDFFYPR